MATNLPFEEGDWVDSKTWSEAFGVSPYIRGISISKKNKLIVCVSTEESKDVPYQDKWYSRNEWDGVLYTGEGLEGDQVLKGGNKRLELDKSAYFFRKKKGDSEYLYCGKFVMVPASPGTPNPKSDLQPDVTGKRRNVWLFHMKYEKGHYPDKLALEMKKFD